MSYQQSITLLRRNKEALKEALRSIGCNVTESTPVRDYPKLLSAMGEKRVEVVLDKIDGDSVERIFVNPDLYNPTDYPDNEYVRVGVHVKYGQLDFVVSGQTYELVLWGTNKTTTTLMKFGYGTGSGNNDPRYAHDKIYSFTDAKAETAKIITEYEGVAGVGDFAAKVAKNHHAHGNEPSRFVWSLMPISAGIAIAKCKMAFTAAYHKMYDVNFFTMYQSAAAANVRNWWTCCKYDDSANSIYFIDLRTGMLGVAAATSQFRVTPIYFL